MTLDLPDAVPLPDPPGSPQLLGDVVDGLRAAALEAWVLDVRLAAPVAATPGWQGTDAAAAAVQLAATRVVTGDLHRALSTGAARLDRHRVLVEDVRAQLSVLREEQDADRSACTARLPPTAGVELATDPALLASVQAVRDGYRQRDAGRAARHADLVRELDDDATAAAAQLTTALAPVSGGARGAHAVTAHLAGVLPGWGAPELTGLGFELGRALAGATDEQVRALLLADVDLLDAPAAAAAALLVLGEGGLIRLLRASAVDEVGPEGRRPLAELTARLVDGALAGDDRGRVEHLLLDAAGPETDRAVLDPVVAVGWGLLARSASLPPPVLLRAADTLVADEAASPRGRRDQVAVAPDSDPLADVLAALVGAGDHERAASFLSVADTWDVLYARTWPTGPEALQRLIDSAAQAGAAAPETVLLAGLEAAGRTAGVQYDGRDVGTPHAFTVAAVADQMAALAAGHLDALIDPLVDGLRGAGPADHMPASARDLVRGIGMTTMQEEARLTVLEALTTSTTAGLTDSIAGDEDLTAGYLAGVVFAGIAWGEEFHRDLDLLAGARRADLAVTAFELVTLPLDAIPGARGFVTGQLTGAVHPESSSPESIVRALDLRLATGSAEVTLLVQTAGFAATVPAGQLPAPVHVSGVPTATTDTAGEAAAAAREQYEASLTPEEKAVYAQLVHQRNAAVTGFSLVEDQVPTMEPEDEGAPDD